MGTGQNHGPVDLQVGCSFFPLLWSVYGEQEKHISQLAQHEPLKN